MKIELLKTLYDYIVCRVRPQTETVEETPLPFLAPAIIVPEPTVATVNLEAESNLPPVPKRSLYTAVQIVTNPQPGDMVYVESFGRLECQGQGEVIYVEDMYENGNKTGIMGQLRS